MKQRIGRILSRALWLAVALPLWVAGHLAVLLLGLSLLFTNEGFTGWVRTKTLAYVNETLGIRANFSRIRIEFPLTLKLYDLAIYDSRGDTLIGAAYAQSSLRFVDPSLKRVYLGNSYLRDASFRLHSYQDGGSSLRDLLSRIPSSDKPEKVPLDLRFSQIHLLGGRFVMSNDSTVALRTPERMAAPRRILFGDMDVRIERCVLNHFQVHGGDVRWEVEALECNDWSGFHVEDLQGRMALEAQRMVFRDLNLVADSSRTHLRLPNLTFDYASWKACGSFVDSVTMGVEIDSSRVATGTLRYFFGLPENVPEQLQVRANIEGRVTSLKIRTLGLEVKDQLSLELTGSIDGLPNIQETFFNVDIAALDGRIPGLEEQIRQVGGKPSFRFPPAVQALGQIHYSGAILGFMEDLVIYGTATTWMGSLDMDVSLSAKTNQPLRYRGQMRTQGLHVGRMLRIKELNSIAFDASVDGIYSAEQGINSHITADFPSINYRGYPYENLHVEGFVTPTSYMGALAIRDSALDFSFDGIVNVQDTLPTFRFNANLNHAQLHPMGLSQDSAARLKGRIKAYLAGKSMETLNGTIGVDGVEIENRNGAYVLDSLTLTADTRTERKSLTIQSDLIRGELYGESGYRHLIPAMIEGLADQLPSYLDHHDSIPGRRYSYDARDSVREEAYGARLTLGNANALLQVIKPALRVAPETNLICVYYPGRDSLILQVVADSLSWSQNRFSGVDLRARWAEEDLRMDLASATGQVAGVVYNGFRFANRLRQDTLSSELDLDLQSQLPLSLRLRTETEFHAPDSVYPFWTRVRLQPGHLMIDQDRWKIAPGRIIIDSSGLDISSVTLTHEGHRLWVEGKASHRPEDTLRVGFQQVDLAMFAPLLGPKAEVQGHLDGQLRAGRLLDSLRGLQGDIDLMGLRLHGAYIGNSHIQAHWAPKQNIALKLSNRGYDEKEDIRLEARVDPKKKYVDGYLRLQRFNLMPLGYALAPLLSSGPKRPTRPPIAFEGYASSVATLSGPFNGITMNGWIQFDQLTTYVNSLNCIFSTSSRIQLQGRRITWNNFIMKDPRQGELRLNGYLTLDDLENPELDLTATASRFLAMNTNTLSQLPYYGQALLSGQIRAYGPMRGLTLETLLKTEAGTDIAFELPSSREAKATSQLTFAMHPSDSLRLALEAKENSGIVERAGEQFILALVLSLSDNAVTRVITNPKTGDVLRVRGTGNIRVANGNERGEMKIYGDYVISKGDFQFTLESLLSKKFKIREGSQVRFSGNPQQGMLDITAQYNLRASLDRLVMGMGDERLKRRIPVECRIHIGGTIGNPVLRFSVHVPQADPESQGLVATALNSEEKIMRQFASLLVLGQFAADVGGSQQVATAQEGNPNAEDGAGSEISGTLLSSFWELFSNRINSWLSEIENAPSINLGFNYRPNQSGLGQQEDEVEVSVSTQWLGGRLSIDANWGVNRATTSSAVAGDIVVTHQSKYVDNFKYKAFAQSNDNLVFHDLSPYTAGAGIVYSNSFDTWRQLWNQITLSKRRKQGDEEKMPEGKQDDKAVLPERKKDLLKPTDPEDDTDDSTDLNEPTEPIQPDEVSDDVSDDSPELNEATEPIQPDEVSDDVSDDSPELNEPTEPIQLDKVSDDSPDLNEPTEPIQLDEVSDDSQDLNKTTEPILPEGDVKDTLELNKPQVRKPEKKRP